MPYLPYEEPGIIVILSLTSFLLSLNGIRYLFDRLLYCGIIGEILIGVIWGLPVGGTAWLAEGIQETIQALGYLGLIGLVFEGGLSTDLALLRKTAYMSISVATIGLLMPIALSFILLVLPFSSSSGTVYPSPLAGFSAGASLCSTSLGTTFAILSSAGMQQTRVGVVLVGAAMMDDVVGLVMINIVTTLGSGGIGGWSIARPIIASFGLLLVTLALSSSLLLPISRWISAYVGTPHGFSSEGTKRSLRHIFERLISSIPCLGFILSIVVLIIFVTIASFIDASVLFAAFIAGGLVNFLWAQNHGDESPQEDGPSSMYKDYFKSVMDFILIPFFFASIGFSIPITDMFQGSIVWKGIIYSILMATAKALVSLVVYYDYFSKFLWTRKKSSKAQISRNIPLRPMPNSTSEASIVENSEVEPRLSGPPHSIALLVGFAMIARGEIGFLIASLSQSSGMLMLKERNGTEVENSGEEVFLVIVWAVVLCTIAGPVGVGITVRRLRQHDPAAYRSWF